MERCPIGLGVIVSLIIEDEVEHGAFGESRRLIDDEATVANDCANPTHFGIARRHPAVDDVGRMRCGETERKVVERKGFEPSTPALRTRCSPN